MATKNVPSLVRGMSAGGRLVSLLCDGIIAQGGHEEMLYFLTTDQGVKNLNRVTELIASLEWRVPVSVIKNLTRKILLEVWQADYDITFEQNFFWHVALGQLGIPHVRFSSEGQDGISSPELTEAGWPLPKELQEQLQGQRLSTAMPLTWESVDYYLAAIGLDGNGQDWLSGKALAIDQVIFLYLVEARYIDVNN